MAQSLELLFKTLDELEDKDLNRFRTLLSERIMENHEAIPRGRLENKDRTEVAFEMQQAYGNDGAVKMTLTILRKMNLNKLADKLERNSGADSVLKDVDSLGQEEAKEKHKKWMMEKFGSIHECTEEDNEALLSKIYTELYITAGESEGVNTQHEVRRIETQSKWQSIDENKISCNHMFNCPKKNEKIRTVMTTGIAGIGKTVCVQKFILDWAEGTANQDVDFIFALAFRQLNFIKNGSYTLHQLLLDFHPELDEKVINPNTFGKFKIILIFDGLDESKLDLKMQQGLDIYNHLKTLSVDVLIANLIKGNLLPSALLWITSRPAAVKQIPPKYIHRWTEVQGFNDQQKDEYFRRKIESQAEADKAINNIKRSGTLYIMCHIPVFCWILAKVFLKCGKSSHFPQTLTEVYISFLLIETNRKNQKFDPVYEPDNRKCLESNRDAILKLSELAYKELMKGNILFEEKSLKECGINDNDLSLYSGMCTEFFKREMVGCKHKVFCFVHLSMQEFLAAFFVFHSFVNNNTEALKDFTPGESFFSSVERVIGSLLGISDKHPLVKFLKTAVDKSLQTKDGHLDLFLRFLLGISLESNQKFLQGLLTHVERSSDSIKKIAEYIRELLSEDTKATERCMNLLYCLLEMKDHSLQEEIQQYMNSRQELSPSQCSRLAYMIMLSENTLDEFDPTKYRTTTEGLKRLLVVLRVCRKARLVDCNLTVKSCEFVASVLQSPNSLVELDLSDNDLGDTGVELLSKGLSSLHCKLLTLRLSNCLISEKGCVFLASALTSNPSHLKELDLNYNNPGESGLKLLSAKLEDPACKLGILKADHVFDRSSIRLKSLPTQPELQDTSAKRAQEIHFCWTAESKVSGRWLKNGNLLEDGGRISITEKSKICFCLKIQDAREEDEGEYTLELSNNLGVASGSAKLRLMEYDVDWRDIDWRDNDDVKRLLRGMHPMNPELHHLRFLLHGPVGAGKSSIIHSIMCVFQSRIVINIGLASAAYTSFTRSYKSYWIKDQQGGALPFVFNDVMGFENNETAGVLTADIISALRGHIRDGHKFNPVIPLSECDSSYNSSPTLNDKVHCLVSVIPADKISLLMDTDGVIVKMREVREAASSMGIPQVVFMTHVDRCCPLVKKDLKHIYSSKKIKQAMQDCSNKLGVPMSCIFPVKNYCEENRVNDKIDCLILDALKQVVSCTNDYMLETSEGLPSDGKENPMKIKSAKLLVDLKL